MPLFKTKRTDRQNLRHGQCTAFNLSSQLTRER
jgi:hypothetical protein